MIYRRRRFMAAGVVLLVLGGLLAGALATAHAALASTGGGSAPVSAAVPQSPPRVWIVRPGDTLWDIALALDPRGDPRPLVDRLASETGGAVLYPGERIAIHDG